MQRVHRIYVIGQNSLLNQLIATAIATELKQHCEMTTDLEPLSEGLDRASSASTVLLVDDTDAKAKGSLFRLLSDAADQKEPPFTAALFDVDPTKTEIHQAVRRGVKGLFFLSDPIQHVLKGVRVLLEGQVWIPREILVEAAVERKRDSQLAVEQSGLTMREIEILSVVATGATNDEIANQLCISSHTVKTHMYNIFQKIGVDNRLHAALWAAQNLSEQFALFAHHHSAPLERQEVARR